MTGKMVACLLGVAVLAGGVGGGAGWMLGHGAGTAQTNAVIEMLPDHSGFAETCRKKGARVEVAVTSLEFDGEGEGAQPVTDATLAEIAALPLNSIEPIRKLTLRGAQITDAGLAHLKTFDFLESLTLSNCPNISDAGLEHLKNKTWLRILTISACDGITEQGVASLKEAFKRHSQKMSLLVTHRR